MHDLNEMTNYAWSTQSTLFERQLLAEADDTSADLLAAARHQVNSGGKRLRAVLPFGTFKALAEESTPDELPVLWLGLCLELLHSGTLAHDDVMDGDKLRRNVPTVWVQFGTPQAINAGDLLFYLAEQAVHLAGLRPEQEIQASRWLAHAMRRVIHGQALEIQLRRDKILPDFGSYEAVVAGKTGGLFGLGLIFGAISAGRANHELEDFFNLGLKLGSLFQIQDDVLDLIGAKGREQKGSDLLEGKPSWLIAHCVSVLSAQDQELLRQKLYTDREATTAEDVSTMISLLDKTQSVAQGLKTLMEHRAHISNATNAYAPSVQNWINSLQERFLLPLSEWLPKD